MKSCDQDDETIWSYDWTKIEFGIIKCLFPFEIPGGDVVVFVINNRENCCWYSTCRIEFEDTYLDLYQTDFNPLNGNAPYFSILLCLMPDDFTRPGENSATQWVNKIICPIAPR
jgi:hypothetical protein